MSLRAWVIFALPWCVAASPAPQSEPATTPPNPCAAESPLWWLRRAYLELTHYQDQRGRRTRQTQMDLLGTLADLQASVGDRAGRIETCRFTLTLLQMRREEIDLEKAILQGSPADRAARYTAIIGLRAPGTPRDETRTWATGLLLENGDIDGALRIAIAIDQPKDRDAALGKVVSDLLRTKRFEQAADAAEHLADVEVKSAGWEELIQVYARLAPVQARLGRTAAAERSLAVLATAMQVVDLTPSLRLSLSAARGTTLTLLGREDEGRQWLTTVAARSAESREDLPTSTICDGLAATRDCATLIAAFPERLRPTLWSGVASSVIDSGDYAGAERALPNVSSDADYARLVRRLVDAGEVSRAVPLAVRIRDRACGIDSYEDECLYEHILASDAMTETLAGTIADHLSDTNGLAKGDAAVKRLVVAARAAFRAGHVDRSRSLIRSAIAAMPDAGRRYLADDVVRAQLAVGLLDDAATLALAEATDEIVAVVRAYADAGRPQDARRLTREVAAGVERASEAGTTPAIDAMDLALAAGYAGDRELQDTAFRRAASELLSTNGRSWTPNIAPWKDLARAYRAAGRLRDLAPVVDQVRRPSTRVQVNMAVAEDLLGR